MELLFFMFMMLCVVALPVGAQMLEVKLLIRKFSTVDRKQRAKALGKFTELGETGQKFFALRALMSALQRHKNPAIRSGAAEALGLIGGSRAVVPLIDALSDPDDRVRQEVVTALGTIADPVALQPLMQILESTEHKGIRRRAVVALGFLASNQAIPLLMNALEDRDVVIRKTAIEALELIHDPQKAGLFVRMLTDENAEVRLLAANALERISWKPATEQEQIAYDIAKGHWDSPLLSSPEAVESLLKVLYDGRAENINARVNAVLVLGKIGEKRAVEPLVNIYKHEYGTLRETVVAALGDIGDIRAVEVLIQALNDKNPNIRMAAATALGKFDDPLAIEVLIHALGDTEPAKLGDRNPEVQKTVAEALGKIQGERVTTALVYALEDDDAVVRRQAIDVLEQRGWSPQQDTETMLVHIAREEWSDLVPFGAQALPQLVIRAKDKDRTIREQATRLLTKLLDSVLVVAYGNLQVKASRKRLTFCNPDVAELTVPMKNLEHLVIHTPTHNFHQVEQFLTYAINYIGQDTLKHHVTVHIYGEPDDLHPNLLNSFRNLCQQVKLHASDALYDS